MKSLYAFRLLSKRSQHYHRYFASTLADLPDSVKRVGQSDVFPNEYPGQIYAFNWSLNGDGVTPVKKSAFRITKPLDLDVAGLSQPKTRPLKVTPAPADEVPEAGSDLLSFDKFDEMSQKTRDSLSLSNHLYCPEGFVPGSHTGVRVISNSASLAPDLLAYLERAPKREPVSQPITVYALEAAEEDFVGYAIEEIQEKDYKTNLMKDPKSVASIVVSAQTLNLNRIVTAIELCKDGLDADEKERAAAAQAEENA